MSSFPAIAESFLQELRPTSYVASGAISLVPQRALLNSAAGALAMTIAAPGTSLLPGQALLIVFEDATAPSTVQYPTAGGTRTRTLSTVGEAILLISADASRYIEIMGKAQGAAFTQTYATADRTVAALTTTTLTDNGGGTADGTVDSQAAPTDLTDSTGLDGTHNDTLAAPTLTRTGHVTLTAPDAAGTTNAADQLDLNGVAEPQAMANLVQPDVPRNLVYTVTDGNASIDAFQIDAVGTGPAGEAVTEQVLFAGGLVQTGSKIFATLTSVTLTSINGNGAGDTLDVGWGAKLGVPVPAGATGLAARKVTVDGAVSSASATDTTNNSFTMTSAPDASKVFDIWFSYTDPADTVLLQNESDLAQKTKELVALATTARNNLKELTTQIAAIQADILAMKKNDTAIIDDLQAAGISG